MAIEAFKKIGYELIIVHKDEVKQLKKELSLIMDIDNILAEAKECSDKKEYMIFYLNLPFENSNNSNCFYFRDKNQ